VKSVFLFFQEGYSSW